MQPRPAAGSGADRHAQNQQSDILTLRNGGHFNFPDTRYVGGGNATVGPVRDATISPLDALVKANVGSKERRRRLRKLRRHPHLRDLVIDRLKAHWSPEQIAGRLLADGVSPVRICPETIYRFVYCKEGYPLGRYQHLPERRRRRRRRGARKRKPRDGLIPLDYRISQRPDLLMIDHSSGIGRAIS
ncbi:hypothetical protein ACVITL_006277 [Rhizobium pisi]